MNRTALAVALALTLSGCAGTFGAHSKPKAGARTEPACDPSFKAAAYLTGVAVVLTGVAFAIDREEKPLPMDNSRDELPGLGIAAGAATAGAIWSAYSAGECRGSMSVGEHR